MVSGLQSSARYLRPRKLSGIIVEVCRQVISASKRIDSNPTSSVPLKEKRSLHVKKKIGVVAIVLVVVLAVLAYANRTEPQVTAAVSAIKTATEPPAARKHSNHRKPAAVKVHPKIATVVAPVYTPVVPGTNANAAQYCFATPLDYGQVPPVVTRVNHTVVPSPVVAAPPIPIQASVIRPVAYVYPYHSTPYPRIGRHLFNTTVQARTLRYSTIEATHGTIAGNRQPAQGPWRISSARYSGR
jgi:hypothetical protein